MQRVQPGKPTFLTAVSNFQREHIEKKKSLILQEMCVFQVVSLTSTRCGNEKESERSMNNHQYTEPRYTVASSK